MATTNLPTIDVAPFLDPYSSDESKQAVAIALKNACKNHGFFYLTGHNIPQETPQEEKDALSIDLENDGARGLNRQ
jgi:isopenicillin N synthase-like dioxygenase